MSTGNINRRHFSYFGIIGANLFEGFRTFGGGNNNSPSGNNNNNNNSLPSLLSSEFEGELRGGFNPPSRGNARELDPNVAALVNALTGANLMINHVEGESNYVKSTKF